MVAAILYLSNTSVAEVIGGEKHGVLSQIIRIEDRVVWCNVLVSMEGTVRYAALLGSFN